MKKKSKWFQKAVAVICILSMMVSLAACGASGENTGGDLEETAKQDEEAASQETDTEEEADSGEEEASQEKSTGDKVEITVWHMLSGVGEEAFTQIVNDFNASSDKYYVVSEFQGSWYDSFAKFKATPKESLPDIYQIVVECMGYLKDSDYVIPIQDYIDSEGFDVSGMQENIRSLYTIEDTLYCMPLSVTMLSVSYNKEALENAGVDVNSIKTIADLDAAAKKVVDAGEAKYGWSILSDGWQVEEYMCLSGDPTFDNNNGRSGQVTRCVMNDNGAADTIFNTFHEYLSKDYNYPPTTTIASSDITTAFLTGDLAMLVGSSQWILKQESSIDNFTLGQIAAPITNEEVKGSFSPGGNGVWMIDKGDAEKQEGAWEFIKYLWQDEVMGYYAAYTGYTPVSTGAYNSEVYTEFREKKPFVEAIWKELEECKPEYVGAVFGSYYDFRNIVMDAFGQMFGDESFGPEDAVERIITQIDETIELYNEANPG